MALGEITVWNGDRYHVTERSRFGDPVAVEHAEEWLRGSLGEARLNLALRIHVVKRELREALPAWLRRIVPEPRRFWLWIWWTDARPGQE